MNQPLFLLLALGIPAAILGYCASLFNRIVRLDKLTEESWAQIDVVLKRRHDLIPNLVSVVKGYAQHEQQLFNSIAAARQKASAELSTRFGSHSSEKELSMFVGQLFARAEAYPELKSDEQFLSLQVELVNTEDRIAAARRFFNANVREFNTALETFPSVLFRGSRKPVEFFELESLSDRISPRLHIPDKKIELESSTQNLTEQA